MNIFADLFGALFLYCINRCLFTALEKHLPYRFAVDSRLDIEIDRALSGFSSLTLYEDKQC